MNSKQDFSCFVNNEYNKRNRATQKQIEYIKRHMNLLGDKLTDEQLTLLTLKQASELIEDIESAHREIAMDALLGYEGDF